MPPTPPAQVAKLSTVLSPEMGEGELLQQLTETDEVALLKLIGAGASEPLEYLLLLCLPKVQETTGSRVYSLEFLKDACLFLRETVMKGKHDSGGLTVPDYLVKLCQERWSRIEDEIRLDEKLYESLRSNDGWAYYYMQKKFFPQVERMVLANSGTLEDAKDIIMDGIYLLLKNIHDGKYSVQTGARLKTYFLRICRNRWLDELKRMKKKMPASLIWDLEVEQSEALYYESYREEELNERQKKVREQFLKGSDVCQNILRMYYYENMSHKEIASRMAYNSEEVSRTQKKKCFEKLRVNVLKMLREISQPLPTKPE